MLSARDHLAVMIDYAVTWSGMDLREFYNRWLGSGIPEMFGNGHPKCTLERRGIELGVRVVESTGERLEEDQR